MKVTIIIIIITITVVIITNAIIIIIIVISAFKYESICLQYSMLVKKIAETTLKCTSCALL